MIAGLDKPQTLAHSPLMNVFVTSDRKVTVPLDAVIGGFRTFGMLGPLYEILSVAGPATGAEVMLKVRVVESGEVLEYPLAHALDDPVAR